MWHRLVMLVAAVACSGNGAPAPAPPATHAPEQPSMPGTDPGGLAHPGGPDPSCRVSIGPPTTLAIPPRLAAVAPQYFHTSARDAGFNDLIPGTRRYAWYDPSDLDVAVVPPAGMAMISHATASFLVGTRDRGLAIARRTDTLATPITTAAVRVADVVEDAAGTGWVLATTDRDAASELHVLRIDQASLAIAEATVATRVAARWDLRLGITATGAVAVVWLARTRSGLAVVAAWRDASGAFGAPIELDRVVASADVAELAMRSTVNLRVAADGADRLAIAWRPLVAKDGERVDPGSRSEPPPRGVTAEVRIVTVDRHGHEVGRATHPAFAQPLEFTTGIGPWPLHGNGMVAASIAGHAVVAWIDDSGATPRAVYATTSGPWRRIADGRFRLLPRRTIAGADELLLLASSGRQQVAVISCGP